MMGEEEALQACLETQLVSLHNWHRAGGIAARGIHDYQRIIYFRGELPDRDKKALRKWLSDNNCPGWTEVLLSGEQLRLRAKSYTLWKYKAYTTMDSSD